MKHREISETALFQKIGRRGLLLIISGCAWIGIGISIWISPSVNRFSTGNNDPHDYLHILDSQWTAVVWAIAGTAGVVIGSLGKRSALNPREVLGFNFILTPPLLWTLAYIWSLATFFLTGGDEGRASSGIALIIYALIVLFILVIAGWPEVTATALAPAKLPLDDEDEEP